MGLFSGNFWKGGVGKVIRGGLNVVSGGLTETVNSASSVFDTPKQTKPKAVVPMVRTSQQSVTPNGGTAPNMSNRQEKSKGFFDKMKDWATDFYEENQTLVISSGVGVGGVALWQMSLPKRKRFKFLK